MKIREKTNNPNVVKVRCYEVTHKCGCRKVCVGITYTHAINLTKLKCLDCLDEK